MRSLKSRRRSNRPRLESLEDRRLLTSGALDTTFGTGGLVTSAAFNGQVANAVGNGANGVAIYPTAGTVNDGKIVVAGQANGSPGGFGVARFNTDGSPDTSFGNGGSVTTAVNKSNPTTANAVAVQPDGKVLAVGYTQVGSLTSTTADNEFALVRYNANGSLDSTFGKGGIVTTNPTRYNDTLRAVALQPDGKIVVAGSTYNQGVSQFGVARYNPDGSLDKTFNGTGLVTTSFTGVANAVAIYPRAGTANDGKIVIAGTNNTDAMVAVLRFNPNGSLDTSFNGTGEATTTLSAAGSTEVDGVVIQPDGNIVAAGETYDGAPNTGGTASDIVLARYKGAATTVNGVNYAAGSLDPTFGSGGTVVDNYLMYNINGIMGGSNDYARSVALQADGKLLVAGSTSYKDASGNNVANFLLARFNTSGSLDTTYGSGGWVETAFPGGPAAAYGVALQPDGKAVAAGKAMLAGTSSFGIGIARYMGDPAATTTSLVSSADSSAYCQSVTFTATVSAAYDVPTGTVEFYDGTTLLGTGTIVVVNGVATATFTISTLSSGTHNIGAIYDGDANDLGSSAQDLSQVVN
jgi:uncharacterized delta-60 repeat protein